MSAVWYIGGSKTKFMGPREWAQKDIIEPETFVWNVDNGWSIPTGNFTPEELAVLDEDGSFLLNKPDGPRTYPPPVADASDPIGSAYAYYRALRDLFESDHVSDKWRGPGLEGVTQTSPYMFQLYRESDSGPIPLGDPITIPTPSNGIDGDDGADGADGVSIADFRATGDGSYGQAYDADGNAIGDPVPLTVAWTTVTNWDDPNTVRPDVSQSVIWIGNVAPVMAHARDIRINTSGVPPSITSTSLNGMNINSPFIQQLYADGTTPQVWTKLTGTLPAGISLSTEGQLNGTPTTAATYNFRLQAANPFGTSYHDYSITVGSAIAPTINTTSLGTLQAGTPFSVPISVSGSTPVTLALKPGDTLPSGFVIDPDPTVGVHGTPAVTGSFSFSVRATNAAGYYDKLYSGTVVGTPPTMLTTSLGALYRAFAGGVTALASSGSSPITYAKISGSYPSGVSINSSGVVSGTPDTVQSYSFVMRATNAYGDSADITFSGNVLQSTPVVVETDLGSMTQGIAVSKQLTLTSGGPTITWSLQSGSFPSGVSINSSGLVSGTPASAGTGSVTVRASNGTEYDDQVISWTVGGLAPTIDVTAGAATGDVTLVTTQSGTVYAVQVVYASFYTGAVTAGVTLDGVAMTEIGRQQHVFGTSYGDWLIWYKKTGVSAGSHTLHPTVTTYTHQGLAAANVVNGSVVGALQGNGALGRNPASHVINSATNHLILHALSKVSGAGTAWTGYSQTSRVAFGNFVMGSAAGASTVTFSGTIGTQNGDSTSCGAGIDISSS